MAKGEPVKVHELGPYLERNIRRIPVYPVQCLHNKLPGTWTRIRSKTCEDHGPGLREKKKKRRAIEKERQIHILKKKIVLKHKRESKEQNNVQNKKKTYTIPNCLCKSKKKGAKE